MKLEVKYGLLIAVAGFVWNSIEFLSGFHTSKIDWHLFITFAFPLLLIGILVYAIREKKAQLKTLFNYKAGIKSGIFTSLIAGLSAAILGYIFYNFVNPDFFDDMKIAGREWIMMSAQTEDQVGSSINMMEDLFSLKAHIILAFVGNFVVGLIGSLIIPFFFKNK